MVVLCWEQIRGLQQARMLQIELVIKSSPSMITFGVADREVLPTLRQLLTMWNTTLMDTGDWEVCHYDENIYVLHSVLSLDVFRKFWRAQLLWGKFATTTKTIWWQVWLWEDGILTMVAKCMKFLWAEQLCAKSSLSAGRAPHISTAWWMRPTERVWANWSAKISWKNVSPMKKILFYFSSNLSVFLTFENFCGNNFVLFPFAKWKILCRSFFCSDFARHGKRRFIGRCDQTCDHWSRRSREGSRLGWVFSFFLFFSCIVLFGKIVAVKICSPRLLNTNHFSLLVIFRLISQISLFYICCEKFEITILSVFSSFSSAFRVSLPFHSFLPQLTHWFITSIHPRRQVALPPWTGNGDGYWRVDRNEYDMAWPDHLHALMVALSWETLACHAKSKRWPVYVRGEGFSKKKN